MGGVTPGCTAVVEDEALLENVQQDESIQDQRMNMRKYQPGPLIFNLSPLKTGGQKSN